MSLNIIISFPAWGTLGAPFLSDGEPGRQALYSAYRLHFGHFGGLGVKLVYVLLGLSLTVVAATGINVWLARRRGRDRLNDLWCGFVWGAPAALGASAIAQVLFGIPSTALFWLALAAAMAWAVRRADETASKHRLQRLTAWVLAALVVGYLLCFRGAALQVLPVTINLAILTVAGVFAWMGGRQRWQASSAAAVSSRSAA